MKTEKQQAKIHQLVSEVSASPDSSELTALADTLIELDHSHSTIGQVQEFMKLFKQTVEPNPTLPSKEIIKLRLNLILEELGELAEACGKETASWFSQALLDKSQKMHYRVEESKVPELAIPMEVFDAFIDIEYVLSGAICAFGMQKVFPAGFEEVHRSNMSKACITLQQANSTKDLYEAGGEDCFIEEDKENKCWFVKRTSDKKILKSIDYSSANLLPILLFKNRWE